MNHHRPTPTRPARTARALGRMLPVLLLCAALGGCASGGGSWFPAWSGSPAPQAAPQSGAGPLADFLAVNAPGAQGQVSDPAFGAVQAQVTEAYVSALGENCRRGLVSGGARQSGPEQVVACQNSDGKWRLLPPLFAPVRVPAGAK